jgi:intracellular multiplication protein IcmK
MSVRTVGLSLAVIGMAAWSLQSSAQDGSSDNAGAGQGAQQQSGNPVSNVPSNLDMLFPLSPEERVNIRERQLADQEASFKPLRDVEAVRDLQMISGQGDQIPEVFVTPDYPSAIVFTDMTGAPWPINYIGQTSSLATVEQPEGTINSLVLQAKNPAGRKSITVFLEGLSLPVTIIITGQDDRHHALKHVRITERGPNAKGSYGSSSPGRQQREVRNSPDTKGGTDLDAVLNKMAYKVTPEGFQRLKANDSSVDAWIEKEDPSVIYVMTDHTVVSPAPISGARSVTSIQDDVRLYVLPRINPIMALNSEGRRIYLTFERVGS